jgi:hypothetical protein
MDVGSGGKYGGRRHGGGSLLGGGGGGRESPREEVVAGRKTAEAGWSSGASRKMKPTRSNIKATHIISLKSQTYTKTRG